MFVVGRKYERLELLKFIGSKQPQSGIIWNKEGSDSVIITTGGRHTKNVGYQDQLQKDGTWIYTGQGGKGDQNPHSFANSLLTNSEKNILLFSTLEPNSKEVRQRGNHKKMYQYEGLFEVKSWTLETQKEGKRKGDKLVKYNLHPIDETDFNKSSSNNYQNISLEPSEFFELRKKTLKNGAKSYKKSAVVFTEYKTRSTEIKKYALLRAKGECENCGEKAPFVNSNNIPFLEVHHIFSLADDGPDHPINVAAICPNCHREAHYGINMNILKETLSKKIAFKEDTIDKKDNY